MPFTRFFTTTGREVFPPRPVNVADDADAPRLRTIIAPPGHFLAAETSPQIATEGATEPIVQGSAIPIPDDDAQFVRLADGSLAKPVNNDPNEALQVPTFFSADAFPEPVAEIVELDVSEEPSAPVATISPAKEAAAADEIRPPTRALTDAEYRALQEWAKELEQRNLERLRRSVRAVPVQDIQPENIARAVTQPEPLIGLPKHRWIDRRTNQLIALNGMHPADAERQAEGEWDEQHAET